MHLLLQSYQSSTDIENQTNVSLVPFQIGGGPEAVVYLEASTPLHIKEVMSILNDPDMDKVLNIPTQHPRGGQLSLISAGGDQAKKNNWSCDGYSWVNKGGYGVPKKNHSFC